MRAAEELNVYGVAEVVPPDRTVREPTRSVFDAVPLLIAVYLAIAVVNGGDI